MPAPEYRLVVARIGLVTPHAGGKPSNPMYSGQSKIGSNVGEDQMSSPGPQRRGAVGGDRCCPGCGTVLAADNTTRLCGRCHREQNDQLDTPPQPSNEFFETDQFWAAFGSQHIGKVFKAYRNHPHWLLLFGKALSQETLGRWLVLSQTQVSKLETLKPEQNLEVLRHYAITLHLPQHLLWFDLPGQSRLNSRATGSAEDEADDEAAALELSRRVAASDVGDVTLTQLELVFDDLAMAYPVTTPQQLQQRLRKQLSHVSSLLDGRKTLGEHRRLVVLGAWLSLLAATVHVDLKQQAAATARLRTAASLARDAGHDEIRAWCCETEAWRLLTSGEYRQAIDLSRVAQELAPGGSVAIQATAQEGRAWARLGERRETYEAIERVNRLVAPLKRPDRPEHHYNYDPDKSVAYVATTLAWLGDPAAESYAREIIARLKPSDNFDKWPRRLAIANLDLALALTVTDRLDEACDAAQQAILSGRVVPANHWRVAEVVSALEARQVPEAKALREAYEDLRRG